jgi:adenylate kinase
MQRKDDNPETLKIRLAHYIKETKPLLEFYQDRKLLKNFDGMVGTTKLFDELSQLIKGK